MFLEEQAAPADGTNAVVAVFERMRDTFGVASAVDAVWAHLGEHADTSPAAAIGDYHTALYVLDGHPEGFTTPEAAVWRQHLSEELNSDRPPAAASFDVTQGDWSVPAGEFGRVAPGGVLYVEVEIPGGVGGELTVTVDESGPLDYRLFGFSGYPTACDGASPTLDRSRSLPAGEERPFDVDGCDLVTLVVTNPEAFRPAQLPPPIEFPPLTLPVSPGFDISFSPSGLTVDVTPVDGPTAFEDESVAFDVTVTNPTDTTVDATLVVEASTFTDVGDCALDANPDNDVATCPLGVVGAGGQVTRQVVVDPAGPGSQQVASRETVVASVSGDGFVADAQGSVLVWREVARGFVESDDLCADSPLSPGGIDVDGSTLHEGVWYVAVEDCRIVVEGIVVGTGTLLVTIDADTGDHARLLELRPPGLTGPMDVVDLFWSDDFLDDRPGLRILQAGVGWWFLDPACPDQDPDTCLEPLS